MGGLRQNQAAGGSSAAESFRARHHRGSVQGDLFEIIAERALVVGVICRDNLDRPKT